MTPRGLDRSLVDVSFNVINVELGACAYASAQNHDPDGDSGRFVLVAPR